MTPEEKAEMKRLINLVEEILKINHLAYSRLIENCKNEDEYCPRKELAIKAAAWEMISDEIKKSLTREENDNG